MPPIPGELMLVTVFVDVHYLISPEGQRPLRGRFEKGSYAYIYRDQKTTRLRLEIANNVGKSYQDAFAGSLDYADVKRTPERPMYLSFVTISASPASSEVWSMQGQDDPLYGIDMYFWTPREAAAFIGALQADDFAQHPLHTSLTPAESCVMPSKDFTISPVRHNNRGVRDPTIKSIMPVSPPSSSQHREPPAESPPMPYNPASLIAPERFGIEGDTKRVSTSTGQNFNTPGLPDAISASSSFVPQQQHHDLAPVIGFSPQRGISCQLLSKARSSPSPADSHASKARLSPLPGDHGFPPPPPPQQPQDRTGGVTTQRDLSFVVLAQSTTPASSLFVEAKPMAPLTQSMLFSSAQGCDDKAHGRSASLGIGNAYSVHSELFRPTDAEVNSHYSSEISRISKLGKGGAGQASASGKLEMKAERLEKGVDRLLKKLDSKWA